MTPVLSYIGLGANLGDPLSQCRAAVRAISQWPEVPRSRCSSFYRSEPHLRDEKEKENWYVNAVLEIETSLSPEVLFQRLLDLESNMGRDLAQKGEWQPRPIDLDLLAYGDLIVTTPPLRIPHPRLHTRRFVLVPWAELAPDWQHPQLDRSIQDLLATVEDDKALYPLWPC